MVNCKYCDAPRQRGANHWCMEYVDYKAAKGLPSKALSRLRRRVGMALGDHIDMTELYFLYNGKCALCGDFVFKSSVLNGPSIDHIVPVSHGGTHTWDNVQLVHWYCNVVKGLKPNKVALNTIAVRAVGGTSHDQVFSPRIFSTYSRDGVLHTVMCHDCSFSEGGDGFDVAQQWLKHDCPSGLPIVGREIQSNWIGHVVNPPLSDCKSRGAESE